jgi:hypothetical protein
MFKSVGHDPECESLCFGNGFFPSLSIGHNAGQIMNLGDPTTVIFSFGFDHHFHNLRKKLYQ